MKKNLFLTGTSGFGKSTLILNHLLPYLKEAAGFATIRLNDENGKTLAFQHIAPSEYKYTQKKYEETELNCFIDYSKKIKSIDCFHTFVCPQLMPSESHKWILMDEIGGFELKDAKIQESFIKALNSDYPCLGVIKWIGPDSHLRSKPHKEKEVEAWDQFIQKFLETDTTLIHVNDMSFKQLQTILEDWVTKHITKGD